MHGIRKVPQYIYIQYTLWFMVFRVFVSYCLFVYRDFVYLDVRINI